MLDVAFDREAALPRDAATVIIVRDPPNGGPMEVFCVERHAKSAFLGGALVFPGGKVDPADLDVGWELNATECAPEAARLAGDNASLRALAVAACRETLEEAAILALHGRTLTHDEVVALRVESAAEGLLPRFRSRGLVLDLAALSPFARWVTPAAESRRFDTRFFLMVAPAGQEGAHDAHETMASFWGTPTDILARFDSGSVQLAPPTHRTLEILAPLARTTDAQAVARASCLDPICPELVRHADATGETLALTLPGDPEHSLRMARVPGLSRFVLRGAVWTPSSAP